MKMFGKLVSAASLVVGPAMFLGGVFSFRQRFVYGDNSVAVAYFYSDAALFSIATGAAIVALGIVLWMWARKPKNTQ